MTFCDGEIIKFVIILGFKFSLEPFFTKFFTFNSYSKSRSNVSWKYD